MAGYKVLVVEDDLELRRTIRESLSGAGFQVREAVDGLDAVEKSCTEKPDLVLVDVNMPRMSGLECLKRLKEMDPSIIVIVMTAYSTIEDAVTAIKEGAYNYLAKPIKHQAIIEMTSRALEAKKLIQSMAFSAPIVRLDAGSFVGNSSEMKKIFGVIHKLAKVDTSVMIRGDSGTGKELVARAIHYNSGRKDRRLVAINCSSIAETLFESELFGHEKGAFTGADQRQIGKFQYAEGGTLFLDEIGDLSPAMQVKLLRVLQERKFTPVGSNREIEMDVRIIAATNRNLEERIQKGTFREDLFYRLNVVSIFLPPLKERKDDITRLVAHFIAKFNLLHKKAIVKISSDSMELLMRHHWPGNIRELENVIEHSFVIESTDTIQRASLPAYLAGSLQAEGSSEADEVLDSDDSEFEDLDVGSDADIPLVGVPVGEADGFLDYRLHKEQFEKEFIIKALKMFKGRINQTAMHAKIPKKTLLRKLQKYTIRAEDYR